MARVRQIMWAEDATIHPSSEAVFLINKATRCVAGDGYETRDRRGGRSEEARWTIYHPGLTCKSGQTVNL
uniref:Uncharacterized protein n=1 Tax=Leersia perrieri TaxID=77586 RepID=A0A0D9VEX7_9ORYZ